MSLPCSSSLSACVNNVTLVAANLSLPCNGETNNVVTCFRPEFMDPKTQCTTLKCPLATPYWGRPGTRSVSIYFDILTEAEAHYVVISVLGWVCFVLSVLIVITSFMQPNQRQFPGAFAIHPIPLTLTLGYVMPLIGICIAVESFGFAMSRLVPYFELGASVRIVAGLLTQICSWFGRGRIDCDTSLRGVCRLQGVNCPLSCLVALLCKHIVLSKHRNNDRNSPCRCSDVVACAVLCHHGHWHGQPSQVRLQ